MAENDLKISDNLIIPDRELRLSFSRSSGPGGQNVNKVNSKATLRWSLVESGLSPTVKQRFLNKYGGQVTDSGELLIRSDESRDQGRNIENCRKKLRQMILSVLKRPKRRQATKPTAGAVERRITKKKRHGLKKRSRSSRDSEE